MVCDFGNMNGKLYNTEKNPNIKLFHCKHETIFIKLHLQFIRIQSCNSIKICLFVSIIIAYTMFNPLEFYFKA